MKPIGKFPIKSEIIDNIITIKIYPNHIKFLTENLDVWFEDEQIKITNIDAFIEEINEQLNEEDEDGSTYISRLLEDIINEAIENGCEGINEIN